MTAMWTWAAPFGLPVVPGGWCMIAKASGSVRAVADGVGAEGGEEGADDGAELQRPEDGEVQLRHALQEDEDAVALLHAEGAQGVGRLVGGGGHLGEGVRLRAAVLPLPEHRGLVPAMRLQVAVYALVGDVQATPGQP